MQPLIEKVDRVMTANRMAELVDTVFGKTYEEEAREAIRGFHDRADDTEDARENYTLMFLADYGRALNWKYTEPDTFLGAYAHRELAVMNGASEAYLDAEAYKLRQEWATKTRVKP